MTFGNKTKHSSKSTKNRKLNKVNNNVITTTNFITVKNELTCVHKILPQSLFITGMLKKVYIHV